MGNVFARYARRAATAGATVVDSPLAGTTESAAAFYTQCIPAGPRCRAARGQQTVRTLFVRNIAFEVDIGALRAEFESHGDISVWFDMIARRGMVFVT